MVDEGGVTLNSSNRLEIHDKGQQQYRQSEKTQRRANEHLISRKSAYTETWKTQNTVQVEGNVRVDLT